MKRYVTTFGKRRYARERRAELRRAELCINAADHGPATDGVLCDLCRITHRGCQ